MESLMNKMKQPISILIMIWLIYITLLFILQKLGLNFGFHVIPMGEDRIWTDMINDSKGFDLVQQYWKMLDRNPLSPWVWWLTTPIIQWSEYSLYIIRKLMDPILACIVFVLINRLGRNQHQTFAFIAALFVLFWNFSGYYEHFMWCFHVALGLGLLSIYYYCGFVDGQRKNYFEFVIAIICYFIAIGIYTFQAGALISVGVIALFRDRELKFIERFKIATKDVFCFLIMFAIYYCIWMTVSRNFSAYYLIDLTKLSNNFLLSVLKFAYPDYFHTIYLYSKFDFTVSQVIIILTVSFVTLFILFFGLLKFNILDGKFTAPKKWLMLLLFSLALPILMVESTTASWPPGSRSMMVTQVWLPIFYLLCIAIFLETNLIKFSRIKFLTSISVISVGGSLIIFSSLDYNKRLVEYSLFHQLLAKGIKKIKLNGVPYPKFIVVYKGTWSKYYQFNPSLSQYGSSLLKNNDISVRMPSAYADPNNSPYWPIKFEEDNKGVINAGKFYTLATTPYHDVFIVFFDGQTVTLPRFINKKDFANLKIEWNRDQPIDQAKFHVNQFG